MDTAGAAGFDLYAGDRKVGSFDAPAAAGSGGLSFVGVSFPGAIVTRAVIRAGARHPDVADVSSPGGTEDVVVMDDLIFGEPVLQQGENTISEAALRVADVRDRGHSEPSPGQAISTVLAPPRAFAFSVAVASIRNAAPGRIRSRRSTLARTLDPFERTSTSSRARS